MQSILPFPFNSLTGWSELICRGCAAEFQDKKPYISKPLVMVLAGKVMSDRIFHLLAFDGCIMANHSVHQSAFGLTDIMHTTTGAFDGIDQIVRPAVDGGS